MSSPTTTTTKCLLSTPIPPSISRSLPEPLTPRHDLNKTMTILIASNDAIRAASEKKVAAANAAYNKKHGIVEKPAMVRINRPDGTYVEVMGTKTYYPKGYWENMEKEDAEVYGRMSVGMWKGWEEMAVVKNQHRCEWDGCCQEEEAWDFEYL